MLAIAAAVLPVFAVILLGAVLRRARAVPETIWEPAELLVYRVLFPALLFKGAATADFGSAPLGPVILCLVGAQTILTMMLLAGPLQRFWTAPVAGAAIQGAIRQNGYIVLGVAAGLYGAAAGTAYGAIIMSVAIPALNVLSVAAFAMLNARADPHADPHAGVDETEPDSVAVPVGALTMIAKGIATNPLIIAIASGFVWNMTGVDLPAPILATLTVLGQGSLALGLLTVGAALRLDAVKRRIVTVAVIGAVKLFVLPLAVLAALALAGTAGPVAVAAVILAAVPSSASAFVMTRTLGGDAPLLAGMIAVQTIAAVASLPLIIALAQAVLD